MSVSVGVHVNCGVQLDIAGKTIAVLPPCTNGGGLPVPTLGLPIPTLGGALPIPTLGGGPSLPTIGVPAIPTIGAAPIPILGSLSAPTNGLPLVPRDGQALGRKVIEAFEHLRPSRPGPPARIPTTLPTAKSTAHSQTTSTSKKLSTSSTRPVSKSTPSKSLSTRASSSSKQSTHHIHNHASTITKPTSTSMHLAGQPHQPSESKHWKTKTEKHGKIKIPKPTGLGWPFKDN